MLESEFVEGMEKAILEIKAGAGYSCTEVYFSFIEFKSAEKIRKLYFKMLGDDIAKGFKILDEQKIFGGWATYEQKKEYRLKRLEEFKVIILEKKTFERWK